MLVDNFIAPVFFPFLDQINRFAFRAKQDELVVVILPLTAWSILRLLLDDRSTAVATGLSNFSEFRFFFAHDF